MASKLGDELDHRIFLEQYQHHFNFISSNSNQNYTKIPIQEPKKLKFKENEHESLPTKSADPIYNFESLLVSFFNVSYYLGVVPHHYKVVGKVDKITGIVKREVKSESSKFHTVFVIIVHVCTLLRLALRFTFLSYNLKNPLNHFRFARTLLSAALCLCFLWSLWMRHNLCLNLVKRLANFNYFPNVTSLKKNSVQFLVLFLFLGLICGTCIDRAIHTANKSWSLFCPSQSLTDDGSSSSPQSNVQHRSYCNENFYDYEEIVLKILYMIFNYFGRVTRQFPRMELLVIALTLWQTCKSFGKYLETTGEYQIREVLGAYEELKEISRILCDLVGDMVICEIVEDIIYFSLEVQLRLRDADWLSILIIFETFVMAFLAKFVASCSAEHIQQVSKWLSKDGVLSQLSPGKVITLHVQLSTNPIGMKGGSLFTLTKGFLANVVTVWLTYFIILLQFEIEFD